MRVVEIGDTALTFHFGAGAPAGHAARLARLLADEGMAGVVDVIPAFGAVTVVYDVAALAVGADPVDGLSAWVDRVGAAVTASTAEVATRTIELPVVYGVAGGGADLVDLAKILGLTPDRLVDLHSATLYRVEAVGFLPGFAYLSGLPPTLHAPRRDTPRVRVPAGSVAIGGPYTGVYPVESPGGWHLIGSTAVPLFDPTNPAATPLRVGDQVRFVPTTVSRGA
ncbi:MAG: Allophanate hydrolase subunit 1 [Phycisphaerales bacterium]|nr:Allophanate hydrolase subunit 1 [Phycisphaerales bacterium]